MVVYKRSDKEKILRDWLALDRTYLANERTMLAYIRTFIGFLASGAGIIKLLEEPFWQVTGMIMVCVGPIFLIVGIARFFATRKNLNQINQPIEQAAEQVMNEGKRHDDADI